MRHDPARAPGQLFVVGCPRTGSTLLRRILNRSPDVCLASETHFLSPTHRGRGWRPLVAPLLSEDVVGPALVHASDDLVANSPWPWLARNVDGRELAAIIEGGERGRKQLFSILLRLYAERACGGLPAIVGEKTPDHLSAVPTLSEWFPSAKVIHTFRDPRAIFASQLVRLRQGRWGPKARHRSLPSLLVDPVLAPLEAVRTRRAWLAAAHFDGRYRALLGERYLLVRFEDLVTRPEDVVRSICAFVGIEFRRDMLEDVEVVGSSFSPSRHAAGGLDASAAARWRGRVGGPSRMWFGGSLAGELRRYGYPRW
jgi:hypothetical protein